MPQLGETVTEGTITKWLKQVGDTVAQDEPLYEVSTDKVDSEVPSPASGVLAEILVAEGETVDVGTRLAVVTASADSGSEPGEPAGQAAASVPIAVAPAEAEAAHTPKEHEDAGFPLRSEVPAPSVEAAPPPPPPPAPALHVVPAGEGVVGAAPAGVPGPGAGAGGVAASSGLLLSPLVRRLVAEHGLDPAHIRGTGAGGRITREDVLAHIEAGGAAEGAVRAAAPGGAPGAAPGVQREVVAVPAESGADLAGARPAMPPMREGGAERDVIVPFTNIRRRTAEHMTRSLGTSAHALVATEADYEAVERARRTAGPRFEESEGLKLTYLPFVARATVEALRAFPDLNASVGDDALIVHKDVHLGIAVDLNFEGLIVPVIHNAEGMTLIGIARAAADLAARARSRRLGADDIAGGTFTITNPGPWGTTLTFPIISQPQVGILATDGVRRRPVVVEAADGGEAIGIRSVGTLGIAFDHRAVDGAYASAFVAHLAHVLATRNWLEEL